MPEIKRLVFGEGLMVPSLDGSKRFTIRKYREGAHDFRKGETVMGEFMDGLDIMISITEDTKVGTFESLKRSDSESKKKGGYHFDQAYFDDLKNFYPDITWKTMGAVISFEILKIDSVPVASLNKYMK